jgi:hypothetical protein
MPITKDQARGLAKTFRDLSNQLGDYRFENWGKLSAGDRRSIEDAEWTLLNHSSDFITTAVGIVLNDMQGDLKAIADATAKAKKVVATIDAVRDVLKVAAALVVLGGAVASQSPTAIASAAGDLFNTSKTIIDKQKKDNA